MSKFGDFMGKIGAGLAVMAEEAEKRNVVIQRQQAIKNLCEKGYSRAFIAKVMNMTEDEVSECYWMDLT